MRLRAVIGLSLAYGVSAFAPPPAAHIASTAKHTAFAQKHALKHGRCSGRGAAGLAPLHALDPSTVELAAQSVQGVSAWSVTTVTADLGAQLFQASLAPYLAFLYFLSRPETKTPKGGTFSFTFLLVFVAATIPAGILAKVQYNDILANVDYLHGVAESFLTITNLLIVKAFRDAVIKSDGSSSNSGGGEMRLETGAAATVLATALAVAPMLVALHPEPANALSWPTWMVHVSSIIEWLVAMAYIWRYAAVSGLQQWKGLTWGMLPLHTSGLCACTYHILYNSPDVVGLVALQAGLTCFGNATMAAATYRIWQAAKAGDLQAGEPVTVDPSEANDATFYGQLVAMTVIGAALVKWGELLVDFPFEPTYATAAALIFGPTAFNVYKWYERSQKPDSAVTGLF
eukprot:TRINITY_DN3348_c0_g1_i1.p1 TRINITY_DN3348_c0_g1~~TRINITY_DN3348_c0_g1_i1.p1  ORF type:complete len:401 (-),score=103.01 TRINITY_DN3348_c0_g1_i1:104-1306(-)